MSMNQSGEQQQQQQQEQRPPTETVTSAAQTNATHPYQTARTTASGTPQIVVPAQQQLAFQQAQQFHHQQQQQLQSFWANQTKDIEQTTDFKNHSLPLARIKKIMKADEDVRMISAEAPVVFAKACEMFILELTLMSWIHTEENKRRTLQKNDIAAAITRTDIFDFLVDIVPRDDLNESFGFPRTAIPLPAIGTPADAIPYYYMHPHHPTQVAVPPGMIYPQSQPPIPYMPWLQPQPPQRTDQQLQPPQTDVVEQ